MVQCPGGEIGRRTRFRFWRRDTWEFESPLGHHKKFGGVAHLGERLICIQEVAGSSPVTSTKYNSKC